MTKYKYIAAPIYWDYEEDSAYIKNWYDFNDEYLSKGWEVERVDELHDNTHPTLMYILRKEQNGES